MNAPGIQQRAPLLKMDGICKAFPGVRALDDVSLDLSGGEVLALIGENGAGKSTLIKILGGAYSPDSGTIEIDGLAVRSHRPAAAQSLGISVIHQEFNLVPGLTVCENLFLGHEETRLGWVNAGAERRRASALFKTLGVDIDPGMRCDRLTVAQQQIVEIGKALALESKIIVMDEPTAALADQEVEHLFAIIDDLKSRGIGVIYVSHRLNEVLRVAGRVMVLRDGACVGVMPIDRATKGNLIEMMVGRPLEMEFPHRTATPGPERLRVEDLRRGQTVRGVSFSVRAGEILGFAGLVGAGRTETMRLIFGADRADGGRIFVDGEEASVTNPRRAIAKRICLLTEDRKGQGLILMHTVRENFGLPNLDQFAWGPFVSGRREKTAFSEFVRSLRIKIAHDGQMALNLSGGNQQKVVLAKWLARNADVIIFDEPTRGIDVGAKYEIYLLMNKLAAAGKSVIMVSSELPEILGMSDRIIVMHEGKITGEVSDVSNTTQEELLALAIA